MRNLTFKNTDVEVHLVYGTSQYKLDFSEISFGQTFIENSYAVKTLQSQSSFEGSVINRANPAEFEINIPLLANPRNKVLVCEAGEDTPPGKVPSEILDSYPGTAYLNDRFIWSDLKVTTEVIPHNDKDAPKPPLRKYEQARVLGGGSSINGQMANRGAVSYTHLTLPTSDLV